MWQITQSRSRHVIQYQQMTGKRIYILLTLLTSRRISDHHLTVEFCRTDMSEKQLI